MSVSTREEIAVMECKKMSEPLKVFITYSHKDSQQNTELKNVPYCNGGQRQDNTLG